MLASVLAVLVHAHLTLGPGRPELEAQAEADRAWHAAGRLHVPVRVRNGGGRAARDVRVRVTRGGPAGAEEVELTFDIVAARAEATGTASFGGAPASPAGAVRAVVTGSTDP